MSTSLQEHQRTTTVVTLRAMKQRGERIACMTAYDALIGRILDEAGMDLVLVGDSLGMVVQGHDTTIPVTVDDVIYHTRCVARGARRCLLMADMPFLSYTDRNGALANAGRILQEGGAQMVKLEGETQQLDVVAHLSAHGVPVCAHLGLQPQRVHKQGGYRIQGRGPQASAHLLEQAGQLQDAGADMILVECIPHVLAHEITRNVDIPVIGIGAGVNCDGQILVLQDALGITPGGGPRFARDFLADTGTVRGAVSGYVAAVREGSFPGPEHVYSE